jgi:hypothetical protein
MSFVKEAGTLHLLRWKRKMSQPFLPLHCSILYDLLAWRKKKLVVEFDAVSSFSNVFCN